jgi:hypothetical protein
MTNDKWQNMRNIWQNGIEWRESMIKLAHANIVIVNTHASAHHDIPLAAHVAKQEIIKYNADITRYRSEIEAIQQHIAIIDSGDYAAAAADLPRVEAIVSKGQVK